MKKIFFTLILILSAQAGASSKSICGRDERRPSKDLRIGRIGPSACTATLISKNCVLTAGHCIVGKIPEYVEFNVPFSNLDGSRRNSLASEVYKIIPASAVAKYDDIGADWAVLKLAANQGTGRFPGDIAGFYEVSFEMPRRGDVVSITGFGRDEGRSNFIQQYHEGRLEDIEVNRRVLRYDIDTESGNSGSTIINTGTQKIVGIHTNGGCSAGGNHGTIIANSLELVAAIKACLKSK